MEKPWYPKAFRLLVEWFSASYNIHTPLEKQTNAKDRIVQFGFGVLLAIPIIGHTYPANKIETLKSLEFASAHAHEVSSLCILKSKVFHRNILFSLLFFLFSGIL